VSQTDTITFTPSLFFKHSTCPHWIWHDCFADPTKKCEVPELAQKLLEEGVLHEEEYVKSIEFTEVKAVAPKEALEQTLTLMKQGASLIYQGEIQIERAGVIYRGRPDLLEKKPGKSDFGDYFYTPVEIKSSKEPKKEHKMQLCLYSMILKQLQGVFPEATAIINRNHERIAIEITNTIIEDTEEKMEEIIEIMRGEKPPLVFKGSCKDTPWGDLCKQSAEEADDICLIYHEHLRSQGHKRLRAEGINTVQNILNMNIADLPTIPYNSPEVLERSKLQAQALREKEIKWIEEPDIPEAPLRIFFDIEGDPLLNIEYLFGFWIAGDKEKKYAKIGEIVDYPEEERYFLYFLAKQPQNEREMWLQFLEWLELLPDKDYIVYHYHHYEKSRTKKLSEEYGTSAAFKNFYSHYEDLFNIVKKSVIFPLYFYSIKDLAKSKFLNFKWRHVKAGGAQSIFWYEKWLETEDKQVLQDIIDYNEDDVRATERLYEWLIENK
jgi:predicted RecB family nuclease